jgi:hypothetical protein
MEIGMQRLSLEQLDCGHFMPRLATHRCAVDALPQTTISMRRTPDAITARDVETRNPVT